MRFDALRNKFLEKEINANELSSGFSLLIGKKKKFIAIWSIFSYLIFFELIILASSFSMFSFSFFLSFYVFLFDILLFYSFLFRFIFYIFLFYVFHQPHSDEGDADEDENDGETENGGDGKDDEVCNGWRKIKWPLLLCVFEALPSDSRGSFWAHSTESFLLCKTIYIAHLHYVV